MDTSLKVVGWLQIALHGVTLLCGLFAFFVLGGIGAFAGAAGGHEGLAAMGLFGTIALFVLGFCALLSLPGMAIGWGIVNRVPWARPLGIVLAILEMVHFPLGFALGIVTLIVLFDPQSAALFDRASASRF